MPMSEEIERLATARASSDEIRRTAVDQGMRTLRQDGWMKVARGSTTITEVLRVTA
jgi:type IV pilus assembly protein PilB